MPLAEVVGAVSRLLMMEVVAVRERVLRRQAEVVEAGEPMSPEGAVEELLFLEAAHRRP